MSHKPRVEAAPSAADWPDLVAELDRWGESGRVAPLWWRDDDATAATPPLRDLLRLAAGTPLALAVIPEPAETSLAEALRDAPAVTVLQHGWRHVSHAGHGRKSEYPDARPVVDIEAELGAGRARLVALFGTRAPRVFVPPWNRYGVSLPAMLAERGFTGLSGLATASPASPPPPGLAVLDVHVDATDWRGGRGFVGTAAALGRLIGWLRHARCDRHGSVAPVGLLTHHLVMDRNTMAFLDRLIALVDGHAAARWMSIAEFAR